MFTLNIKILVLKIIELVINYMCIILIESGLITAAINVAKLGKI